MKGYFLALSNMLSSLPGRIALVEFAGMDPVEAVTIIRRRRRGAINEKQLNYLGRYRRSYRKGGGAGGGCCAVS